MKLLKSKIIFIILMAVLFVSVTTIFAYEIGGYQKYLEVIEKYSTKYGVDKNLVLAIAKTESNFNENAVSNKGAVGIMQIMPKTAEFISQNLVLIDSYNLHDANLNLQFGIAYLRYLLDKFKIEDYAILAYNAGEGKVSSWLENDLEIPYKETKNYLKKISRRKSVFKIITA